MTAAGVPRAGRPLGGRSWVWAWDLPTRLFHWLLVALFVSAYVTREVLDDPTLYWHRINGYAILTLLLFRLFWGVVGSSTSRLSRVTGSPIAAIRYGLDALRGAPRHFLGHNPLGGWLIVVMFLAVAAQAVAGLFTSDQVVVEGPLVKFASEATVDRASAFHTTFFYVILAFIAVHVAANLVYQFVKRDRLITSMVTGRKPALPYEDEAEARIAPAWRALICLSLAAAIVVGGVMLAGDSVLH